MFFPPWVQTRFVSFSISVIGRGENLSNNNTSSKVSVLLNIFLKENIVSIKMYIFKEFLSRNFEY